MRSGFGVDVAFWVFAVMAIVTGWRVFRTDSMVRASFLLLASFLNVGAILLLLDAHYLGLALFFMMAVEMMVMAVFMVMFMMNPAGLNPMSMVHQPRVAAAAGTATFLLLGAIAVSASFPDQPVPAAQDDIVELGEEMMGPSMLVFQSVGVTLLATMIGAVVLSTRRGRFGDDDEGSRPPVLDPATWSRPDDEDEAESTGEGHHGHGQHGHSDHGGHG